MEKECKINETIVEKGDLERAKKSFISIQNLEKVYPNGAKAVFNFNLDIQRNEFIVIVGPSGCGKTTTLRMIAGLEDISSGSVYINNEFVNYKPSKDRNIAIVFQSYALYPQMSVYDNISFPLTINKYKFPVVRKKLKGLMEVRNILTSKSFVDIVKIIHQAKKDAMQGMLKPYEALSQTLDISIIGGEILFNLGFPGHLDPALNDKEKCEELLSSYLSNIDIEIAKEKEDITKNNIILNDQYEYLDKDGNAEMVDRKMDKYEIRERVFSAAKVLDLGPYLGRLPKELSGGQMQRVALGRAIVKNVPLFLMDEPLSNLDAKLRLNMRSEIVKIHNRINATTIYVTHDQTEAMTMATRIVVMSKGFVQQIDTPSEIYNNPKNLFVAKFVGSPSINVFEGTYKPKEKIIKISDNIELPIDAKFVKVHKEFYTDKLNEFEQVFSTFDSDYHSQEFILKVLSSVGNEESKTFKAKHKESLFTKISKFINKKKDDEVYETPEQTNKRLFQEKIDALKDAVNNEHKIIFAIRPERMNVVLKEQKKEYPSNFFEIEPTVCELLGNEYIIHFDFLGRDMTAKVDSKIHVDTNSRLMLSFDKEDLLFFDSITGERIYYHVGKSK